MKAAPIVEMDFLNLGSRMWYKLLVCEKHRLAGIRLLFLFICVLGMLVSIRYLVVKKDGFHEVVG